MDIDMQSQRQDLEMENADFEVPWCMTYADSDPFCQLIERMENPGNPHPTLYQVDK